MSFSKLVSRFGVIAGIGCTIHCFFEYICDFVVCSGESMQPTLFSNNVLICNKIANRLNKFNRNDIIIAIHPHQPKSLICKRLIAVPGDIVLMNTTKFNENPEDDSDVASQTSLEKIYITPGACWVEGDNRLNSTDSRNYGPIPMGLIRSKVIARIWPPSDFRMF